MPQLVAATHPVTFMNLVGSRHVVLIALTFESIGVTHFSWLLASMVKIIFGLGAADAPITSQDDNNVNDEISAAETGQVARLPPLRLVATGLTLTEFEALRTTKGLGGPTSELEAAHRRMAKLEAEVKRLRAIKALDWAPPPPEKSHRVVMRTLPELSLTDDQKLLVEKYRRDYSKWRQGKGRGASGEVSAAVGGCW